MGWSGNGAVATTAWQGGNGNGLSLFEGRSRERLRDILDDGTPENTKRAYGSDMRYFWQWCEAMGLTDTPSYPVPAEVIARYVVDHVEGLEPEIEERLRALGCPARKGRHKMSTIDRRIAALASAHKAKGLANPCVEPLISQLLSKARRASAKRGIRCTKKRAAVRTVLEAMLSTCEEGSMIGVRDAALLQFGWASGGRRRSEIASATMERLEAAGDEYLYHLGVTKTDQEGDGLTVPVAGPAALALRRWLEDAGIESGPIFRAVDRHGNLSEDGICGRTVARVVQSRAKAAGLDPSQFAGHSLRSGFVTEAGAQGVGLLDAMALSGHKTVQVAAGYHQAGAALLNKAARLQGMGAAA